MKIFGSFAVGFMAWAWGVAIGRAIETKLLYDTFEIIEPSGNPGQLKAKPAEWRKTKATFYGNPYDDGKRRICADGQTVYTSNGTFCATRLVPLGTVIEVRRGKVTLRLKVTDTQAKRYGHLIDIPTKTWDRFGAKRSVGMLPVEWRRVK